MLDNLSMRRLFDRLVLPGMRYVVYHNRLNCMRPAAISADWYRTWKATCAPSKYSTHGIRGLCSNETRRRNWDYGLAVAMAIYYFFRNNREPSYTIIILNSLY